MSRGTKPDRLVGRVAVGMPAHVGTSCDADIRQARMPRVRGMSDPKEALTDRSDRLLAELSHLKATEAKKRLEDISSPPFHELADEVLESSRRVFGLAAEQAKLGDEAERGKESIEDIEREG